MRKGSTGNTHMTPEEREQIIAMLKTGVSENKTAKHFNRGQATVSRLARDAGIDPRQTAAQIASSTLHDYGTIRRVGLLNEFFTMTRAMLPTVESPKQLQELSVALAILIDKRRLEDGESTSRTEIHDHDSARAQLAGRLDELAARRARRVDSESDGGTGERGTA
jgi:transposase-like protein